MLYLPLADVFVNPAALFLIGLCTGLLSRCFGPAAQLLAVPSLYIFGFPTTFAVSTSITAGFGRSAIALFKTDLLYHAHKRLGVSLGFFGIIGVIGGHFLLAKLSAINFAAVILTVTYIIFLLSAATVCLWRIPALRHKLSPGTLQLLRYWPFRQQPAAGTASFIDFVSLPGVAVTGFGMGFATGFWGLGAGLAGTILLTRALGTPSPVAAATDLLAMLIIGAGALGTYALSGQVEIIAGLILLAGLITGSRAGSWCSARFKSNIFSLAFGGILLLACVSLVLKRLGEGEVAGLSLLGGAVLFCSCLLLAPLFNILFQRQKPTKEVSQSHPASRPASEN